MTTIAELNKGDRIKVTNRSTEPEETHEFTVHQRYANDWVFTTSGLYLYSSSWTFELIEPAKPPLPTTPGLYGMGPGRVFSLLDTRGRWYTLDFTAGYPKLLPDTTDKVTRWADKLELLFDHEAYSKGVVSK